MMLLLLEMSADDWYGGKLTSEIELTEGGEFGMLESREFDESIDTDGADPATRVSRAFQGLKSKEDSLRQADSEYEGQD